MRAAVAALLVATCALASCEGVPRDLGLDAELRVANAQFRREGLPLPDGGPSVKTVSLAPRVTVGSEGACNGSLDPTATGVVLALEGDRGVWLLPAGIPDVTAPDFPTFDARLGFGKATRGGERALFVYGVDEAGRTGPPLEKRVVVLAGPRPSGAFVVSLSWSSDADLDLHVVEPNGVEIWKRNRTSTPATSPGEAPPARGGLLDVDSNASCVADGKRAENVVYEDAPPRGRYTVRVDTFSLCGAVNAYWKLEAALDGRTIGRAEGTATEIDTRFSHDRGAGVTALELDVP